MAEILIIDDDEMVCETLSLVAKQAGFISDCEHTRGSGLERARREYYDLVLLDVDLPDGSGLEIISELKETSGHPEIIILTGYGSPDGAELAIRSGAWDYLEKGSSIKSLIPPLQRVLLFRNEKLKNNEYHYLRYLC
jgi:two-component system NtrC family response regulator